MPIVHNPFGFGQLDKLAVLFRLYNRNSFVMDYRFAELYERRFREVVGPGVYHSTELFFDYVPDKLCPPQGWKSYLALELGGRIVKLNH